MAKKIEPLSNVRYFWEHVEEGYPDKIRLAMSDGKIVTYRLEVEQPKPKSWNPINEIMGYPMRKEYQPKHAKRPAALQR